MSFQFLFQPSKLHNEKFSTLARMEKIQPKKENQSNQVYLNSELINPNHASEAPGCCLSEACHPYEFV